MTKARMALLISVLVTGLLYVVPFGSWLAWPLILISTVAHESGHGLMANVVGGAFQSLKIHGDASGVARWSGEVGRFGQAAVSAGGLLGPAFTAAALFGTARTPKAAQWALGLLGLALVLLTVFFVRNLFGFVFVGLLAALALGIARFTRPETSQLALVFTAVQLSLSVFSRADYLFTPTAHTASGVMPSDVASIADALLLPYWVWGLACGGLSLLVLGIGLANFLRR